MPLKTIKSNLLFWKILAVFSGLLLLLAIVFVFIATRVSRSYYTTAHQQLYGNIASHLATFTHPLKDGKPDTSVTHDIIHSIMVANPSVEVYLLDTNGNITDYVVPDKSVKTHTVNIATVHQWLYAKGMELPMGDNPKQPGVLSIFSAAPVKENGKTTGYVYAVLCSEKQTQILANLNKDLYFKLGAYIFFSALCVVLVIGAVTFFLITDSICRVSAVVRRFKEGDHTARIEGHAKGNLGMLTTTFNEMADVIVDNFEKVQSTDKFRQELIANVSHDLRTPLSIIQGYIETLIIKQYTLDEKEKEKYLLTVLDSTQKLSALVAQLFQYSKLEANQVQPEKEQFLLTELASDTLMSYQLQADKRKIKLLLDAVDDLPPVFADVALTERVFQNLLDNALKFTPDGGSITIQLQQLATGIHIRVADTGIGIPAEEQAYIFERYKQTAQPRLSNNSMGIGLAIVKKILELHHTGIEVDSLPGHGTAFSFVLPFLSTRNPVLSAS